MVAADLLGAADSTGAPQWVDAAMRIAALRAAGDLTAACAAAPTSEGMAVGVSIAKVGAAASMAAVVRTAVVVFTAVADRTVVGDTKSI